VLWLDKQETEAEKLFTEQQKKSNAATDGSVPACVCICGSVAVAAVSASAAPSLIVSLSF
jgi:pantothenate kinase